MAIIVQKDKDKKGVLRAISKKVPLSDITSQKIKKIIADMKKAVAAEDDGVAIAAPQIGKSLRIFIISKIVFDLEESDGKHADMVFINPTITKSSRKKTLVDEGCLSIRPWYGTVERALKVTVVAYDEKGKKITQGASGLLAQIFQHEIDHLDGVLFTDKADEVHKMGEHPKETNDEK